MATYSPSKITKDGNTYNFTDDTKIPLSGTSALSGSIIPSTDNAYDLGSSSYKLRYVYAGTAYVTDLNINGKAIGTDASNNMTYDGHIVDTIEEQGNGYIRYSNGLQICYGLVANNNNIATGITRFSFPIAFNSIISVVVSSAIENYIVMANAESMTTCVVHTYAAWITPIEHSIYPSIANYIVIGYWK